MSHSVFIRDLARAGGHPPHLLAFDIRTSDEARAIVRGIASSYSEHGINPDTHVHWFRHNGSVHEIYLWPQV